MKLVFLGPQGSGKGTQAEIISKKLGIRYIGTGELLRQAKGKQKKTIESFTLRGQLVPTRIVFNLIKEKLLKKRVQKRFYS